MSSHYEVSHKGITLKIKKRTTRVNGKAYINFEIREHTPDGLVRHKRASLQAARETAKEICEAIVSRKQDLVQMDPDVWGEVLRALEILPPSCLRIDRAAQIVLDSMRYVDADVIVEACRCFKQNNPGHFTPKLGKEVTAAFRDRQRRRVSIRRARTESSYLNAFEAVFAERIFGTIQTRELRNMVEEKGWSKATRNDALNTISNMFQWAIGENWAFANPANSSVIERERLGGSDISYFTPGELRLMLKSVDDDLKPFMALWAFSGCRKEEASRLEWSQINQGLKSGAILLRADQSKTRKKRELYMCESLRAWLMKYRQSSGSVLPVKYRAGTPEQQIRRLDDLPKRIMRHTKRYTGGPGPGITWQDNGIRAAFALYHLKVHRDPRETARVMGTSLRRLDENYLNMTDSVVLADAEEWFNIVPDSVTNIVTMPSTAENSSALRAATAV